VASGTACSRRISCEDGSLRRGRIRALGDRRSVGRVHAVGRSGIRPRVATFTGVLALALSPLGAGPAGRHPHRRRVSSQPLAHPRLSRTARSAARSITSPLSSSVSRHAAELLRDQAMRPRPRLPRQGQSNRDEHEVVERSASRALQTGDILFGQVVSIDGIARVEACAPCTIPPISKIAVIKLRKRIAPESDLFARELAH
jgi:hypothetical protein